MRRFNLLSATYDDPADNPEGYRRGDARVGEAIGSRRDDRYSPSLDDAVKGTARRRKTPRGDKNERRAAQATADSCSSYTRMKRR
jgi:hypothetical protein